MSETTARRRATSMADFEARMSRFFTAAGVGAGLAFQPRPDDVIIAPFAKCGTTWLQQMVHSLRTGGDLDFDDISRVVPWLETSTDLGLDLQAAQRAAPRAFKSHLSWDAVPKGGRYIVAVRDPRDALVSMYRFMVGWFIEPGSVSLEEFARGQFLDRSKGRDYWTHLASWWRHRHDAEVLLLAYEHMKQDLPGTVRRVAAFIGIADAPERIAAACEEASYASMAAHKDRYDDLMMRERSEQVCDLPPGGDSAKVARGQVGAHRGELPEQLAAELDAVWRQVIEPEFGLADYAALLAALAAGD